MQKLFILTIICIVTLCQSAPIPQTFDEDNLESLIVKPCDPECPKPTYVAPLIIKDDEGDQIMIPGSMSQCASKDYAGFLPASRIESKMMPLGEFHGKYKLPCNVKYKLVEGEPIVDMKAFDKMGLSP